MSKYIDLLGEIGMDRKLGTVGASGSAWTLRWLDDHPGQVPGRTITAAKFNQAVDIAMDSGEFDTDEFARQLGITVAPDSEPTNAELIERKLRELREEPGEWMTYATDSDISGFARALDAKGVKAVVGKWVEE